MFEPIGAESSASITATKLGPCGDCSATTATLPSATPSRQPQHTRWPSISGFTTDQIASIDEAGVAEVFDIQVERTENFIANGLVSHNTRWHDDDLAGRLLKKAATDPEADQWVVLRYPAIAEEDEPHRKAGEALHPSRWPLRELTKLKAALTDRFGLRWWLALFQQRPSAATGDLFKRSMPTFSRYYQEHPVDAAVRADRVFLSIDANFKETDGGSYGCARVLAQIGTNFHVIDEYRARAGYSAFKAGCKSLAGKYPTISVTLIEDKANGSAMIDELSCDLPNVIAYDKGAKSKREAWELWLVPAAESGALWLPDPKWAPWVHDNVEEYIAAKGEKKEVNDRLDCDCQVLAYVRSHAPSGPSWLDVFAQEARHSF